MLSRFRKTVVTAVSLLLVASIIGCGGNNRSNSQAPGSELSAQDVNQATKFVAATKVEAEALVKLVNAAVAHQDVSAFNALIDEARMVDRILAGFELTEKFRTGFMQGMREGGGLTNLSSEIIGTVQRGGDYTFVRMIQKGDELRPLFRLVLPDSGGMNYHELIVTVDASRQPRIADIDVHLSGELLSQSIRRLVLPAVAAEDSGILAKLTGAESEFLNNVATLKKISELNKEQKPQEAMALFASLPETLQKDKTVLLTKLLVAQSLGDAEYSGVISDLERYFPNDTARDFRAMDLLAIQGQHEELIKTVDRLIAVIQDPYLNTLKIDALLALNRLEEARKSVREAKAAAPDRIDVYWVEIAMTLKVKDYAATAALLDEIGEKFGMTFNDLTTVPEYADFAASDIGKDWMARQAEAAAAQTSPSDTPASPVPGAPTP